MCVVYCSVQCNMPSSINTTHTNIHCNTMKEITWEFIEDHNGTYNSVTHVVKPPGFYMATDNPCWNYYTGFQISSTSQCLQTCSIQFFHQYQIDLNYGSSTVLLFRYYYRKTYFFGHLNEVFGTQHNITITQMCYPYFITEALRWFCLWLELSLKGSTANKLYPV